ncbi:DEAD/DEAH box helicase [Virgibacillus sp. MSP4-1]|uniref:DEAD/DEAH box helicase n=1 Tax=Virgibacillus sp. MSP4-1 TaxID=2700081 RepID=UPI0003A5BC9C|nr:DEAD/DEAH box helicase [Virgibacillus sp. MSP4-1]QHS23298.1 DEAD/DEAH box helicase [Virgibacillus sp. MSP4-1]
MNTNLPERSPDYLNPIPSDHPLYSISVICQSKLLLRQEIPASDEEFQELIKKQYIQEVPGIDETVIGHVCRRCGNQSHHWFGKIPQGRTQAVYCRKCIEMGRVSTFEPLYRWTGPEMPCPKVENPCQWDGRLTKFQEAASEKIKAAMADREQLLVWAVCGAGKTEMLFAGLTDAITRGDRICLATPRADVVRELVPRFRQAFPDVTISALYGGSEEKKEGAQLVISTTHQLLRFEEAFDVMIIDEVDAFPYHADKSLSFASERARRTSSSLIYLTATPRKGLKWKARLQWIPVVFVPARYHGYPLPIPHFVSTFRLAKHFSKDTLPKAIQAWIQKKHGQQRRFLLFVPTIEMAENLSKITGIDRVDAADPDRIDKIEGYRRGEMNALITTTILERGVTFPSIDVAVIDAGHNVFDEAALVQIAGRSGRNAADPDGDVVFFHQGLTKGMKGARKMIAMMNRLARRN